MGGDILPHRQRQGSEQPNILKNCWEHMRFFTACKLLTMIKAQDILTASLAVPDLIEWFWTIRWEDLTMS